MKYFILLILVCFIFTLTDVSYGSEKMAVVIGISKYKDHNLLALKYPQKDAIEFKRILIEHAGVSEDNIKLLTNSDATKLNIKKSIYNIASQASKNDEVYIFFSGYGTFIKDVDGDEKDRLDECIIPYDGKIAIPPSNYIIDDEFARWLKNIKSRNIVIILDAEKGEGMGDFIIKRGGATLITSAASNQMIREEKELGEGTFIHFFKEALENNKIFNKNDITLKEIFKYVKEKVEKYAKSHKYKETPVMKGKSEKEIVFYKTVMEHWKGVAGLIVFTSDSAGNRDLYLIKSDGTDKTNITRHISDDFSPVWSPDGKKIAFLSNRTGNFDVFTMDYNGKNVLNVSNSPDGNYQPSWSPDCSKITYTARSGNGEKIFIVKSDGKENRELTSGKNCKDTKPLWAPDGEKIAFLSNRSGINEIYTVNPYGTELINLTVNTIEETDFLWSPDGNRIAFIGRNNGQTDLYVMNSDGTKQKNLTSDSSVEYDFSWSPDGKNIAFTSTKGSNNISNVFLLNIANDNILQLTSDNIWKRTPSWSPEGNKIIFCTGTKIPTYICGLNTDGTNAARLAGGQANNEEPAWCPKVDMKL